MDLNTVETVVERPERSAIRDWRPGDAWLGGGTWLFSEPQPHLTRLFDLAGFGWPPIEVDAGGVTIAATCRIAELERWSPDPAWVAATALVSQCCRALWGSFKVWNAATVGGNLCLALPAGPMTALAAALEGTCFIWGAEDDREMPADAFVRGPGLNALRPGEILRAVRLPASAMRKRAALRQISLTPLGRSAALLIGTHGREGDFRLTVTGATVRPVVLSFPEPPPRDVVLRALADLPSAMIFDDAHGRPAWRRRIVGHLARDILDELLPP